jgi:hypothetical protein
MKLAGMIGGLSEVGLAFDPTRPLQKEVAAM